ncbi:DUF6766 family protein [Streptomyces sp. NPDC012825]|uniref:DUF6766 family protein n=1 Tax=Streptomyces sp. NPDC012825 TaxID=3364851 RepID=UPI0036B3EF08
MAVGVPPVPPVHLRHGLPAPARLARVQAVGRDGYGERARSARGREQAKADSPRWAGTEDWRQALCSRSLGLVMAVFFLLSWPAQSVSGVAAHNELRPRQLRTPIPWRSCPVSSDFWSRSLQNWQSELPAVASMAVLSVYPRQRGSPESKPAGAKHDATGVEG